MVEQTGQMTEYQLKEQEKLLLEFEADLLKFEEHLKAKQEKLEKKESDVDKKISEGQGLPKKSIEILVREEFKDCLAKWQKRGIPQMKLLMELDKTSWGKQTKGAFK